MNPWADLSIWQGDGVRRELFCFNSGEDRLYGSLYSAVDQLRELRLVLCLGWGFDFFQMNDLVHSLALGVARLGGSALLFHPSGHGDSTGSLADLTVERSVRGALDAAAEAERRTGLERWDFAGVRIGAATAVLAADAATGRLLPLVAPVLDLEAHFKFLRSKAKRLSLGRTDQLSLYGHPMPTAAMESLPQRAPLDALVEFEGTAAAIRFAEGSEPDGAGANLAEVAIPGAISNPAKLDEQNALATAAVEWIDASTRAEVVA